MDGETLLVSDPLSQAIWPFALDGRSRQVLPPLLKQTLKDLPPQVIVQVGDKYYAETPNNRILTLGKDFSFKQQRIIKNIVSTKSGPTLLGIFLWQPVGSDLLAFGDMRTKDGRESSGFVRFPADDPASFVVLPHSMGLNDPPRVFYQLGFTCLAALGDEGYILSMENPPTIYRSTRQSDDWDDLKAFPEGFNEVPMLPTFTLRRESISLMEKIEQSKMPVGLYGWEGFLFVLTREPVEGGTRWMIHKIDPRRDEVVGSSRIPTQANHLTVVPGLKQWAFLEKGHVDDWGRQKTDRVLFVPASRLRGSLSPNLCNAGELSP